MKITDKEFIKLSEIMQMSEVSSDYAAAFCSCNNSTFTRHIEVDEKIKDFEPSYI